MNKVYFPNLNGIRFIAALFVIIHHVEQLKGIAGLKNNWDVPFIGLIGKLGVILFFVLSGFLITYLLLVEEKTTNTISIKSFYFRRILRIWPLYYFIVILSFILFSNIPFLSWGEWSTQVFDNFKWKIIIFILFLPNLALIIYQPVPYASQTWSVGVEEQFYLVWPVLMKYAKNKLILLHSIIITYILIKY